MDVANTFIPSEKFKTSSHSVYDVEPYPWQAQFGGSIIKSVIDKLPQVNLLVACCDFHGILFVSLPTMSRSICLYCITSGPARSFPSFAYSSNRYFPIPTTPLFLTTHADVVHFAKTLLHFQLYSSIYWFVDCFGVSSFGTRNFHFSAIDQRRLLYLDYRSQLYDPCYPRIVHSAVTVVLTVK
jgi:hypothetical protein